MHGFIKDEIEKFIEWNKIPLASWSEEKQFVSCLMRWMKIRLKTPSIFMKYIFRISFRMILKWTKMRNIKYWSALLTWKLNGRTAKYSLMDRPLINHGQWTNLAIFPEISIGNGYFTSQMAGSSEHYYLNTFFFGKYYKTNITKF